MTAAAHFFPNYVQMMAEKNAGGATSQIELTSANSGTVDTIKVALFTGTFNWVAATQAYTTIAQFLANAGSGGGGALTEVSLTSTGYTRQALSGVTWTQAGLVSTLNATSPISWTAGTVGWSASYAAFYDYTVAASSDTNGLLIAYWDFGGSSSVVPSGTFSLNINASGIATFTSS